jgi:hypothetical protein
MAPQLRRSPNLNMRSASTSPAHPAAVSQMAVRIHDPEVDLIQRPVDLSQDRVAVPDLNVLARRPVALLEPRCQAKAAVLVAVEVLDHELGCIGVRRLVGDVLQTWIEHAHGRFQLQERLMAQVAPAFIAVVAHLGVHHTDTDRRFGNAGVAYEVADFTVPAVESDTVIEDTLQQLVAGVLFCEY